MTALAQGEQGRSADNRGGRPLLRGWLHVGAFFAWLIGGPFLIAAGPDAAATTELAIYVAGMLIMFGTSAAFHRLRWSASRGAACGGPITVRSSSGSPGPARRWPGWR